MAGTEASAQPIAETHSIDLKGKRVLRTRTLILPNEATLIRHGVPRLAIQFCRTNPICSKHQGARHPQEAWSRNDSAYPRSFFAKRTQLAASRGR